MTISREEALDRARALADERGWPWREPVEVSRTRSLIVFGRERWLVTTHVGFRGGNVRIEIDAGSGAVVSAGYLPR